jgi:predicted MFS family arabinose efflux permease
VRAIYPQLVPKEDKQRLFSLDATLQELIWIFGPVLATLIAATIAPLAVMVLMAVVQVLGTTLFLVNPEVGSTKIPPSSGRMGGVLKNRAIMGLVVIGALLIGSFSGVEVGTVGILDPGTAGLVIAVFSVGSLVGGFVIGPRAKNAKWLTGFNLLILAGYAPSLLNPGNPWWLALCWFISGLGIAPALGLTAMLVSVVLKHGDAAEAYGWIMSGQLVGYSVGAAVAGFFIDNIGHSSGLWVASIFQVATILACLIWMPSVPAFGNLDQTQSIPVIADQH